MPSPKRHNLAHGKGNTPNNSCTKYRGTYSIQHEVNIQCWKLKDPFCAHKLSIYLLHQFVLLLLLITATGLAIIPSRREDLRALGTEYSRYRSSQNTVGGRGHSTIPFHSIPPFHSTIPFHRSIPLNKDTPLRVILCILVAH